MTHRLNESTPRQPCHYDVLPVNRVVETRTSSMTSLSSNRLSAPQMISTKSSLKSPLAVALFLALILPGSTVTCSNTRGGHAAEMRNNENSVETMNTRAVSSECPPPQRGAAEVDPSSAYTTKVLLPDCAGYIVCTDGMVSTMVNCPMGTKYVEDVDICEFKDFVAEIELDSLVELNSKGRVITRCTLAAPKKQSDNISADKGGNKPTPAAASSKEMEALQLKQTMDFHRKTALVSASESNDTIDSHRKLLDSNPFLPDYPSTSCRNDKPAESWMTSLAKTAERCCSSSFSWAIDECNANTKAWLISDGQIEGETGDEVSPDGGDGTKPKKYYPDSQTGICLEDGPTRPSWITQVVEGYENCCNLLSWSTVCMDASPDATPAPTEFISLDPTFRPTTPVPTFEPTTPIPTVTPSKPRRFYPDSTTGICKEDGPTRPSWITTVVDNYQFCCTTFLYWNQKECLEQEPGPPTMAPTTNAPTEEFEFWSDFGKDDDEAVNDDTEDDDFQYDDDDDEKGGTNDDDEIGTADDDNAPKPTRKPTRKPSKSPTPKPTRNPTPRPTESYLVLEISTFGQLTINNMVVPAPSSNQFTKLKIALTKTIIFVLMDSGLVHSGGLEVQLWSIGGVAFNWRRLEELQEEGANTFEETNQIVDEYLTVDRNRRRDATAAQTLQFELAIPTRCGLACQENVQGHLGHAEFDDLVSYLQGAIQSGSFTTSLRSQGEELGLFKNESPSVTAGSLTYRYALQATGLTWMPSPAPTASPVVPASERPSGAPSIVPSISARPTGSTYYPDYELHICRLFEDGGHSEFEVNFFKSLEDCCNFPWIDTNHCMKFSRTNSPTNKPTRKPRTRRPTPKPTFPPTPSPTASPLDMVSSELKMFYPDIVKGVCRSDGVENLGAMVFTNSEDCCSFLGSMFDYDSCLAFANSNQNPCLGKFWPDFGAGFCRSDGQDWGPYSFDSAEICCDNPYMDYDECVILSYCPTSSRDTEMPTWSPTTDHTRAPTRKPSKAPTRSPAKKPTTAPTMSPTKKSTKSPTMSPTKSTGVKQYYPDLSLGVCKSDGLHEEMNAQTFFENAHDCCNFLKIAFDYDNCMAYGGTNPCVGSFYPDLDAGFCRTDGQQPSNSYSFESAEACCDNGWFDYDQCLSMSYCPSNDSPPDEKNPTPKPTNGSPGSPTPKPSKAPTNAPTKAPTMIPTKRPTDGTLCVGPFYPDFGEKLCRADGNQSPTSYKFDSVEECCDNRVMNYNKCLSNSDSCTYDSSGNVNPMSTPHPSVTPTHVPSTNTTPRPTSHAPTTQPTTRAPTPKPITIPPTKKPTSSPTTYTLPPVVNSAINANKITSVIEDDFERSSLEGGFPWHTSTDFPWSIVATEKNSGSKSARSSPVGRGEQSDLHIAISSPLGGALYFYLKTEVQMPHSGCYVNIDGFSKTGYTYSTNGWVDLDLEIEPGDHVVMWRAWSPDVNLPNPSSVSNTIYLDEVSFQPKLIEDFEGNKLLWKNSIEQLGSGIWSFDRNKSKEGTSSFRSPNDLEVGQKSRLTFVTTVPRRGSVLTFWYDASVSSTFDRFTFEIKGENNAEADKVLVKEALSPGWESYGVALQPGQNTLVWEYEKLSNAPSHPGEGAVWIDNISIIPRT